MREKLIELISATHYGNYLVGENFQEGFIAKIADHLIANGVTVTDTNVGKWIPVTERLPIPYEKVFTCRRELLNGTKIICNEYIAIEHCGTKAWSNDYETWKSKVTHWMPLPQPPKGE